MQLILASCVLLWQIVLGGLTVLKLLAPSVVSFHLINALTFVSLLLWVVVKAFFVSADSKSVSAIHPVNRVALIVLPALIFAQILLGGVAGVWVMLKLFGQRIKEFFGFSKKEEKQ